MSISVDPAAISNQSHGIGACLSYSNKILIPKPRRLIPIDAIISSWSAFDEEVLHENWWESHIPSPSLASIAKEELMRYVLKLNGKSNPTVAVHRDMDTDLGSASDRSQTVQSVSDNCCISDKRSSSSYSNFNRMKLPSQLSYSL
jgi:hypothetical protein